MLQNPASATDTPTTMMTFFSKPGPMLWLLLSAPGFALAQAEPTPSSNSNTSSAAEQPQAAAVGLPVANSAVAVNSQSQAQVAAGQAEPAALVNSEPLAAEGEAGGVEAKAAADGQLISRNIASIGLTGQALVDHQASQLLQAMSYAVRSLNYRGLLSYEHGTAIDTLRIAHKVDNGREYERVYHLNGLPAEYLSQGRSLACQATGDKILRGANLRLGDKLLKLADLYHFQIPGLQRVAGRPAFMLRVIPKGKYRFGYNIAIDKQTGFPLMTEVVGPRRAIMERFQFVDIEFNALIAAAELQASSDDSIKLDDSGCDQQAQLGKQSWEAGWLPDGFVFVGQKASSKGGDLLMFTDGLSAISVFVDQVEKEKLIEGRAVIGATVIYISKLKMANKLYSITVVGEVPGATALKVGESLRPYSPGRPAVVESVPGKAT